MRSNRPTAIEKDYEYLFVDIKSLFLDLPEGIVRFGNGATSWVLEPHLPGVKPGYQRNAYLDLAAGKMKNWGEYDEDEFTPPRVSLREDGTNATIDGGGRIVEAEKSGLTSIYVKQLRGKTREREAQLFEKQKHIRKLNLHHLWNASADNPESPDYKLVNSINRVFHSLGWTVGPGKQKSIAGVEQIKGVVEDYNLDHLLLVMRRVNNNWGDATTRFPVNKKLSPDALKLAKQAAKNAKAVKGKKARKPVAVSGIALRALADMLHEYPKLDVGRLDETMRKWSPKLLSNEIKRRNGNKTPHTRDAIPLMKFLMVEFYDNGLRIKDKLTPKGYKLGLVAA